MNTRRTDWIGLSKHITEGKIEGIDVTGRKGKDASSYWMTLGKPECTGNIKRKH
jgi:hypothetical protein